MFTKILALLLILTSTANAAYFPTFSINNFNALGVYNLVPPTLSNGQTANLQLDSSGELLVKLNSVFGTLSVSSTQLPATLGAKTTANSMAVNIASDQTVPISAASLPLPSGASTSANQAAVQSAPGTPQTTAITVQGNASGVALPISAASLPLPTGSATSSNQTSGLQKTQVTDSSGTATTIKTLATQVVSTDEGIVTNTVIHGLNSGGGGTYVDVKVNPSGALVTDGSGTTQPISAASLPLPTGASTSALQTTGNTSLSSIDGKIANNYGVASGAVRTAAQVGNASGVADFGSGTTSAQTLRAVLASDQPGVQTKQAVNTSGSGSAASATVSVVTSLAAPANAVGFILMNLDTSTANIRWSIGRTATTTLGQQLQPGRDTGFIPCGANVSLVAESGTQNYDIQWVSQ